MRITNMRTKCLTFMLCYLATTLAEPRREEKGYDVYIPLQQNAPELLYPSVNFALRISPRQVVEAAHMLLQPVSPATRQNRVRQNTQSNEEGYNYENENGYALQDRQKPENMHWDGQTSTNQQRRTPINPQGMPVQHSLQDTQRPENLQWDGQTRSMGSVNQPGRNKITPQGMGVLHPAPIDPKTTITYVQPSPPVRQANWSPPDPYVSTRVGEEPTNMNDASQIQPGNDPNWRNQLQMPTTSTPEPVQFSPAERFSTNLFQAIASNATSRNIVYSPLSVHSLLAMIYIGSNGRTADELQQVAQLSASKQETAEVFQRLLGTQLNAPAAFLAIATKMYSNQNLGQIREEANRYFKKYFNAEAESADFAKAADAAYKINSWVAERTANRIQNLISPNALDEQTEAILVNAIYFKAKWNKEFSESDTTPAKFWVTPKTSKEVSLMFNDDVFNFANIQELNAKVIELPYADSDLSMMLLLPNNVDGLMDLEKRLANVDLNEVAARLRSETVVVRIPKFRIEFDIDMVTPLKALGINRMFSENSEIKALFKQPVRISNVKQKAAITVNEAGSEAAASTYAKFVPLSLPVKINEFIANHPFMFAIRSPQAVLFIGHVVNV